MSRSILWCSLVFAVFCLFVPAAVRAQNAKVTLVIANQGLDVEKKAWFGVYQPDHHDSYIDYAYSGNSLEVPADTYDIGIIFEDDAVKHEEWLTGQALEGEVRQTVELGIKTAKVKFTVTNNGADVGAKAWWGVYPPGERDTYIAYKYSGQPMTIVAGTYDIGIEFNDDSAKVKKWLPGEKLENKVEKTVELGQPLAEVTYTVSNNGADVGRKAWWGVYRPGKHDSYISYKYSGETMTIPAGTYDIGIEFSDGSAKTVKWLENEELEDKAAHCCPKSPGICVGVMRFQPVTEPKWPIVS